MNRTASETPCQHTLETQRVTAEGVLAVVCTTCGLRAEASLGDPRSETDATDGLITLAQRVGQTFGRRWGVGRVTEQALRSEP